MYPKNPLYILSILILFLLAGNNLMGQNLQTKSTEVTPIIETKKKVFFDVDWKTWFVVRDMTEKPLSIKFFSNKPISADYEVNVGDSNDKVMLNRDKLKSKSTIRHKYRAKYIGEKTVLNSTIYLQNGASLKSNVVPIEIAYRRFSSQTIDFEGIAQDVEFQQQTDNAIATARVSRYSMNFDYHIIDLLVGVAGVSTQLKLFDNRTQKSRSFTVDEYKARWWSYGYFLKLKPIKLRRLLLAPYYIRRYYQDEYTFRDGSNFISGRNVVKTKEDQFGLQAFLLFKNKRKQKHEILTLKVFYQYANQTNETEFRLKEKRGYGMTLNYSFW